MPDALPKRTITLTVNGKEHSAETEDRYSLADFLRHALGLTGTHLGCEHGVCGACTVLVDGEAVRGCLMLAALQCGFCTPGILTTLTAYLRDHPNADEPELREALSGNICRCTGYDTIVRAALAAAEAMRGRAEP